MPEPNSRRQLPPLSPKSEGNEDNDEGQRVKKTKKKKTTTPRAENDGERPRRSHSTSRQRSDSSSPRRSASRASTTDPNSTTATHDPAKKKKKKTASRELLMSGDEVQPDSARKSKHKKKKKKKKTVTSETEEEEAVEEVGLAAELGDVKDDVVVMADDTKQEETVWAQPAMRSEPANKVFIEQRSGFKVADKHKVARKREAEEEARYRAYQAAQVPSETTIQLALASHRGFKVFTVFLQGLFAGLALWQIVGVYILSNRGFDVFLEYYYEVALPVQSTYFFLFALCTVSAFDRYDIGRPTRRLVQRAFTMQSGAVACLFYVLGLVLSTAIAATDDKIGLFKKDDTLWEDEEARDSELSTWRILNLVRGLCPIIGWFIVSLKPSTDRLSKNLIKADENMLMMDTQTNFNNVASSGV